jgi:hypothetical protein
MPLMAGRVGPIMGYPTEARFVGRAIIDQTNVILVAYRATPEL